jgi:hypothetical protein
MFTTTASSAGKEAKLLTASQTSSIRDNQELIGDNTHLSPIYTSFCLSTYSGNFLVLELLSGVCTPLSTSHVYPLMSAPNRALRALFPSIRDNVRIYSCNCPFSLSTYSGYFLVDVQLFYK